MLDTSKRVNNRQKCGVYYRMHFKSILSSWNCWLAINGLAIVQCQSHKKQIYNDVLENDLVTPSNSVLFSDDVIILLHVANITIAIYLAIVIVEFVSYVYMS